MMLAWKMSYLLQIEEHRGPCRCKCSLSGCHHYRKVFDEEACLCRCKPELAEEKRECAVDFERRWHEDTCTCKCRPRICVSGQYQDPATCQCRPIETCAVVDASSSSSLNRHMLASDLGGRTGGISQQVTKGALKLNLELIT